MNELTKEFIRTINFKAIDKMSKKKLDLLERSLSDIDIKEEVRK